MGELVENPTLADQLHHVIEDMDFWVNSACKPSVSDVRYWRDVLKDVLVSGVPPPQEWQPMDTAPKDRNILAWLETERSALIHWHDIHQRWHEPGMGGSTPLCWMPLPVPPPSRASPQEEL